MTLFKKKKRSDAPTKDESLNCVPHKNDTVVETSSPEGDIILVYSVKSKPIFARIVKTLGGSAEGATQRKLQLDRLGASVWGQLDGRRTVKKIIRRFAREHAVHPREAEVAVTRFLYELGRRGLIGLG